MLATESLKLVSEDSKKSKKQSQNYLENFEEYLKLSEIYQAYSLIDKFVQDSFRSQIQGPLVDESVFNSSRFIVNNLGKRQPNGINIVFVYFTLATLGYKFEAYKTAREGFEKLTTLKIPAQWAQQVELDHLKIRSKPFQDKESLQYTCSRCIQVNPLINPKSDTCTECGAILVRNFGSFDTLPLVEFIPDPSIPPIRVKELLKMDPPVAELSGADRFTQGQDEQVLQFNQQDGGLENDLFAQCVLEATGDHMNPQNYRPVMVNE